MLKANPIARHRGRIDDERPSRDSFNPRGVRHHETPHRRPDLAGAAVNNDGDNDIWVVTSQNATVA
jgi:hypothetical protein